MLTTDSVHFVTEVDEHLNAIKGGGACLLREKVVAEAAKTWVLVADNRKGGLSAWSSTISLCVAHLVSFSQDSKILGTTWKQGIPIEVVPFAWSAFTCYPTLFNVSSAR